MKLPQQPGELLAEDVAWMRVENESSPGALRRRAVELAERVGLDEDRTGEIAIVATELATNLTKYAQQGSMVLRVLRRDTVGGVEMIAIDHGPGMRNAHALFVDGESTSGTLGIGLGAVRRLANTYDVYSLPGKGTVLTAAFWPDEVDAHEPAAGLTRPVAGEDECGDAYSVRRTGRGLMMMMVDGLGHGPLAARASAEAVRAFRQSTAESPAAVVRELHQRMSATRGAAVAVAQVDLDARRVTYAGIGNISGRLVGSGRPRGLVSMPGIVGHNLRGLREMVYDLDADSWLVLHSDGLTDKWAMDDYPGLLACSPLVVAATLLRDAAVRRDDAGVLVCRTERS
jgi:anti-sigma regulatory factor (Ser/Thr protein kinase)